VASRHNVSDVGEFVRQVLVGMGMEKMAETDGGAGWAAKMPTKEGSVASDEKQRKRVVSKKMKETYMALEGATEENLAETVKAYKDAAEVESFEAFARARLSSPAPPKTESVASEEKQRKRVVSKKMKETYMAMEGATEENLAEAVKAYKDAAEVDSFEAFARDRLGVAAPEKKKEKKEKKEKSGRFDKWTPTSTKLFKTIVEESGGVVSDELKTELHAFIDKLSDEDFAATSIQGHMRSFITQKIVEKKEDDEEEQEEFDFEGETLWMGVKSGKIYRQTDEAGDVLIGQAGKGRFSDVKMPA
jgi:hypothetical protein